MAESKRTEVQNVVKNNKKDQPMQSKSVTLVVQDGRLVPDDRDINPGVIQ